MSKLDIDVQFKNAKGWLSAPCPFAEHLHQYGTDLNPSFMVKVSDRGASGFNCFSCHQRGNLTRLMTKLGKLRGQSYDREIIRAAIEETPKDVESWDDLKDQWIAEAMLDEPLDSRLYRRMYPSAWREEESRLYLLERGVSEVAATVLDLRHDPDSHRVLFPVYDDDHFLYGFTGRAVYDDIEPRIRDYAGLKKDRHLLGQHLISSRPGMPIVLVEGLFALAHLVTIGATDLAVPMATMGSYLSQYQAGILADYGRAVYLLYDNDMAGSEGLFGSWSERRGFEGGGAVDKLKSEVPTFVCLYPEGVDDPDDLTLTQFTEFFSEGGREYQ